MHYVFRAYFENLLYSLMFIFSVAENSLSTEVYVSDDDEGFTTPSQQTVYTNQPSDTKME